MLRAYCRKCSARTLTQAHYPCQGLPHYQNNGGRGDEDGDVLARRCFGCLALTASSGVICTPAWFTKYHSLCCALVTILPAMLLQFQQVSLGCWHRPRMSARVQRAQGPENASRAKRAFGHCARISLNRAGYLPEGRGGGDAHRFAAIQVEGRHVGGAARRHPWLRRSATPRRGGEGRGAASQPETGHFLPAIRSLLCPPGEEAAFRRSRSLPARRTWGRGPAAWPPPTGEDRRHLAVGFAATLSGVTIATNLGIIRLNVVLPFR